MGLWPAGAPPKRTGAASRRPQDAALIARARAASGDLPPSGPASRSHRFKAITHCRFCPCNCRCRIEESTWPSPSGQWKPWPNRRPACARWSASPALVAGLLSPFARDAVGSTGSTAAFRPRSRSADPDACSTPPEVREHVTTAGATDIRQLHCRGPARLFIGRKEAGLSLTSKLGWTRSTIRERMAAITVCCECSAAVASVGSPPCATVRPWRLRSAHRCRSPLASSGFRPAVRAWRNVLREAMSMTRCATLRLSTASGAAPELRLRSP